MFPFNSLSKFHVKFPTKLAILIIVLSSVLLAPAIVHAYYSYEMGYVLQSCPITCSNSTVFTGAWGAIQSSLMKPLSTDSYAWALNLNYFDPSTGTQLWFQAGIIVGLAPDSKFYSSPTFYVETDTIRTYSFKTFPAVIIPVSLGYFFDNVAICVGATVCAGGLTGDGGTDAWEGSSLVYTASNPFPSGQQFIASAFLEIHQAATNYGLDMAGQWSHLGFSATSVFGGGCSYDWGSLDCNRNPTNSAVRTDPTPPTPYYITSVSQTVFNAGLQCTTNCGGGGSVAYGTLITMADGSRIPVQNLQVGAVMLGYNTTSDRYITSVVRSIHSVITSNMLVLSTSAGVPFRVDANPAQTLWVKLVNGTVTLTLWMPVTQVRAGDYLFTPNGWVAVTGISYAASGRHTMYDIIATAPYFADGYLDPQHKN